MFANNFVLVQDQRTRWTLGTGHESQGSYQLLLLVTCVSTSSPTLAHKHLHQWYHLMILQHHLLLQTLSRQCRLHQNFPLPFAKVFSPLANLILFYAYVLNYDRLSPSYLFFGFYVYLKSTGDIMTDSNWKQTMSKILESLFPYPW